jgi:glycosyltransferase involved in cell wall biosynthesis
VSFLCGTDSGPLRSLVPEGAEVITLSPRIPRSLFSRLALRRAIGPAIERIAPDIVFLPGNFHLILAGGVKKAKTRAKTVVKISNPLAVPARFAPARWLTGLAFRGAANEADWLVAMSSGLLDDVQRTTRSARASVIYDPNVDGNDGPPPKRPIDPARIRLLAAGRLVPQKDWPLALRIVAALPEAQLTILGEGELRPQLERLAIKLGIADRVTMPGHAASITPALDEADLLLITSRYEGGPAVAVEALDRGVPVIATDCSHFLRDLIATPACGTIVASRKPAALAEAIRAFIRHQASGHAVPRETLAPYRTKASAQNYLKLFDDLVA